MDSYKIQIEDGRVPITINNERNEKLGVVYINPNDFNILNRLDEVKAKISAMSIGEDEMIGEKIKNVDIMIREQINYLFDYNVADVVFKKQHSLSIYRGMTFIERLLNALTPVIREVIQKETEKSEKRMLKYTGPYINDHERKAENDRTASESFNNK